MTTGRTPLSSADYGGALPIVSIEAPDDGVQVLADDVRTPIPALLANDQYYAGVAASAASAATAAANAANSNALLRVLKAGDTMTGGLVVNHASGVSTTGTVSAGTKLLLPGPNPSASADPGLNAYTSRAIKKAMGRFLVSLGGGIALVNSSSGLNISSVGLAMGSVNLVEITFSRALSSVIEVNVAMSKKPGPLNFHFGFWDSASGTVGPTVRVALINGGTGAPLDFTNFNSAGAEFTVSVFGDY